VVLGSPGVSDCDWQAARTNRGARLSKWARFIEASGGRNSKEWASPKPPDLAVSPSLGRGVRSEF
jgi:hypothetical protein